MKKKIVFWFCAVYMGLFLTACRSDSVLLIGGETVGTGQTAEALDARETEQSSQGVILVHICGAVVTPGVYELPIGSRVYQLLELAGGFSFDAAEGYLNLAAVLTDGQKIVIPTVEEAAGDRYGVSASEAGGPVNINTADEALLMTLPGIGASKAQAIIAWRKEHGNYQTKEDIMLVPGIKEAAYEKIKSLITVD